MSLRDKLREERQMNDRLTPKMYAVTVVTDKRRFVQDEPAFHKDDAENKIHAWIYPHEKVISIEAEFLRIVKEGE